MYHCTDDKCPKGFHVYLASDKIALVRTCRHELFVFEGGRDNESWGPWWSLCDTGLHEITGQSVSTEVLPDAIQQELIAYLETQEFSPLPAIGRCGRCGKTLHEGDTYFASKGDSYCTNCVMVKPKKEK